MAYYSKALNALQRPDRMAQPQLQPQPSRRSTSRVLVPWKKSIQTEETRAIKATPPPPPVHPADPRRAAGIPDPPPGAAGRGTSGPWLHLLPHQGVVDADARAHALPPQAWTPDGVYRAGSPSTAGLVLEASASRRR